MNNIKINNIIFSNFFFLFFFFADKVSIIYYFTFYKINIMMIFFLNVYLYHIICSYVRVNNKNTHQTHIRIELLKSDEYESKSYKLV